MKVSQDSQQLRITKSGLEALPAELVVIVLWLVLILFLILPFLAIWQMDPKDWFVLLPSVFCLFILLLLSGGLVAYLVQKLQMSLEVDANWLRVRYEPVPFGINRELASRIIKQVYCQPQNIRLWRRRRNRFFDSATDDPNQLFVTDQFTAYQVCVMTTDFEEIEVLSRLGNKEEAFAIVQKINQILQPEAQPVKTSQPNSRKF